MVWKRFLSVVVGAGLLLSCQSSSSPTEPDDPTTPPDGVPQPLPLSFQMSGTAASTERDGTTVSCTLDLLFELGDNPRELPGVLEYDAVHGGSLRRTVLDAAGNGVSLWPDVHGEAIVRSIAPNRLEIEIPANVDAEGRFYRQLARIVGTLDSGSTASGSWTCAPFDIDSGGWVDTKYTANGTWTLAPMAVSSMLGSM